MEFIKFKLGGLGFEIGAADLNFINPLNSLNSLNWK